jgi:hemolysin D
MNPTTPAQQTLAQSAAAQNNPTAAAGTARVIALCPPSRWHDPLRLIQNEAPSDTGRIVLWAVSTLVLALIGWAAFGKLAGNNRLPMYRSRTRTSVLYK